MHSLFIECIILEPFPPWDSTIKLGDCSLEASKCPYLCAMYIKYESKLSFLHMPGQMCSALPIKFL